MSHLGRSPAVPLGAIGRHEEGRFIDALARGMGVPVIRIHRQLLRADLDAAQRCFYDDSAGAFCAGFASTVPWYSTSVGVGWLFLLVDGPGSFARGGPLQCLIGDLAVSHRWPLVTAHIAADARRFIGNPPSGWSEGPIGVRADLDHLLQRLPKNRAVGLRPPLRRDLDFLIVRAAASLALALTTPERALGLPVDFERLAASILSSIQDLGHIVVAENAVAAPCGYALLDFAPSSGHYFSKSALLHDIVVDPSARGLGVGPALTRAICELARAAGADTIYSTVMHPQPQVKAKILSSVLEAGWVVDSISCCRLLERTRDDRA